MKKIILFVLCVCIIVLPWILVVNDTNYVSINSSDDVPEYVRGHEDEFYINPKSGDVHSKGDEMIHIFIAMVLTMGGVAGIASVGTMKK